MLSIQNEAGSDQKHRHNEKTLELQSVETVSRPYPFSTGFVLDTTSNDGDNLDCYVITGRRIRTGAVVECTPMGLLEQIEDGEEDHNVLAALPGEHPILDDTLFETFGEFIAHVFDHVPGKSIAMGRLLPAEDAIRRVRDCRGG